ncbi:MAG TPA: hypothetical protein VNF50_02220 [Acidimicrobiales bacterium]|nr:hypothetical protein [Acidimicrobiales bacterium]
MTSISVNLGASLPARRTASLSIRGRIEILRHFVGEEPLVSALGLLWLLDGALQFQPFMFSPAFVNGIMAPTAVLLWPRTPRAEGETGLAPARRGPLGATTPLVLWSALWVSLAWYSLLRANRAADTWHDLIVGMTSHEPGWVSWLDRSIGGLVRHHGLEASVSMAVVCGFIGIGIHLPALTRPVVLAACGVGGFVWVKENFGGIFTLQGTDPNSGPLLVLLGLAFLAPARAPRLVPVG